MRPLLKPLEIASRKLSELLSMDMPWKYEQKVLEAQEVLLELQELIKEITEKLNITFRDERFEEDRQITI